MRQQEIGGSGGISPLGGAQLEGAAARDLGACAQQHQDSRQHRYGWFPGDVTRHHDGRDEANQEDIPNRVDAGGGEGHEQQPVGYTRLASGPEQRRQPGEQKHAERLQRP